MEVKLLTYLKITHLNLMKPFYRNNSNRYSFQQIILKFTASLFIAAVLVSCSSSTDSGTGSNGSGDFPFYDDFHGELGSETVLIDEEVTSSALTHLDEETHTFTFRADILEDAGVSFEEGEILLLANTALRKISSVNHSGDEIILETEFASINEAFRNLEVNHAQKLDFRETVSAEKLMLEYDGHLLPPTSVGKAGDTSWEYELGDVTVEGTLETSEDEATIVLLVKYETGGATGGMKASLNISGFENNTAFTVTDHETESFEFKNSGLQGRIDMEFVMAGGGDSEVNWEPPMPALVIPFTVGVIPLRFRIGPHFVFATQLQANATAQFESSFNFSGDLGVEVEGTNFTPVLDGGISNPGADAAEGNAAGFGGLSAGQFGIALPKVSLSAFGEAIVPRLSQEFYVGASYRFPTCTRLFSRYEINAGVDMKMFGLLDLSFNQNLVTQDMHDHASDGCEGNKGFAEFPYVSLHNTTATSSEIEVPFRLE